MATVRCHVNYVHHVIEIMYMVQSAQRRSASKDWFIKASERALCRATDAEIILTTMS
jgi:hypothetical protein